MAEFLGGLWLTALSEVQGLISTEGEGGGVRHALDWVFKLHTQVTLLIFVLSSGILQMTQVSSTIKNI